MPLVNEGPKDYLCRNCKNRSRGQGLGECMEGSRLVRFENKTLTECDKYKKDCDRCLGCGKPI